jgi:hypothetical protein
MTRIACGTDFSRRAEAPAEIAAAPASLRNLAR